MTSFAVLAIAKITLVCGAAFLSSRVCRRARASIRHLLFALAFAALVVVPGAGAVLPIVAVRVPAPATGPVLRIQSMASGVPSTKDAGPSASSTASISEESVSRRFVTIAQVVAVGWLTGVGVFLLPVMFGLWQAGCLRQGASPWTAGQALAQTLAPTLGVRRPIDTLLHEDVTGPMTCGVLKPAIILPAGAEQWDAATLRCALTHELEHVARCDFLTHCLSRVICAAYWFHPLVWAAWRRLRLEAERACDDAVLRQEEATAYALLLVSIAQRNAAGRPHPLLTMAGRDDLAARVTAVLANDQSRGRVGRPRATGLILASAIAIIGLAPITPARAMPQAPTQDTAIASIKRNPSSSIRHVDGRMIATNVSLRQLLIFAFGVREIEMAPWWIEDTFDIVATAPADFAPQQGSKTLQSLLTERFKLTAHRGSKEFPIYALVMARPDGSLGPRMTRSQLDCSSEPGASSRCVLSTAAGRVVGRGVTMDQLARLLPTHVGNHRKRIFDRELVDRTGLSDRFDFTLEWSPESVAPSPAARSGSSQYRSFTSHLESNAPSLLAALEEQLGLTVDSQLAAEPVLVIDTIERPAENQVASQ
jgi:bla regulator protein blaR1